MCLYRVGVCKFGVAAKSRVREVMKSVILVVEMERLALSEFW